MTSNSSYLVFSAYLSIAIVMAIERLLQGHLVLVRNVRFLSLLIHSHSHGHREALMDPVVHREALMDPVVHSLQYRTGNKNKITQPLTKVGVSQTKNQVVPQPFFHFISPNCFQYQEVDQY